MAVFTYVAIDPRFQRVVGTLTADTPAAGRRRLREQGLKIESFGPARLRSRRLTLRLRSRRRCQEQVAEVARALSLLLACGTPLTEALAVLTRKREGRLVTVLKAVRDRVSNGESLGDALAVHTDWFDPLFVSAVRVGELSGNLDEALSELAEHLRAKQALHGQVTGALTYPLILVCVGLGVVLFLMTFVIPQLLAVLTASGRPLPASTRLLKGFSDGVVNYWVVLLLAAASLIAALVALYHHPGGRRRFQRLILRMPIAGALMQKTLVAQFAQSLGMLLRTGIPFVDAARSVAALTRNQVLADELNTAAKAIESGSDIAPTLERSRVFPPLVVHLIAVGQDSGELTKLLGELRTRYDTEVRIAVARLTALLEPLLIVLLAAVVGFVVFACLMPILEATRGIAG